MKDQYNIAFIYPRFTGPFGGERHVLRLAESLMQLGNKVKIYTTQYNHECDEIRDKRVKIRDINCFLTDSHDMATLLSYWWMGRVAADVTVEAENLDLICGIGWQSASALAFLVDRLGQDKVWYYCLEPPRFIYDLYDENDLVKKVVAKIVKKSETRAVRKIANVLANGDYTKEQLWNIYDKKSEIVYPGVEKDRFEGIKSEKVKRKLGLEGKEVYLSVSKLHRRKKVDKAIDYFVKNSPDNSVFYIIGGGPAEMELMEKVVGMRTKKKIVFRNDLSDEQVSNYYKAADYFIFMAKNEPFGLAPQEAKLAGCKLVGERVKVPILSWRESAEEFLKQTLT